MQQAGLPFLSGWQNFYIIIGAAAATLTGLMFVVITLIAGIEVQVPVMNMALSAFNTPTVTHFCAVLLLAGLLSAPWPALLILSILLRLVGVGGVIYLIIVLGHLRRMPTYKPPLKDWVWYGVVPLLAYLALIGAGVELSPFPQGALYAVAAVMITLLFTGIRNAWDLLTYLAIDRAHPEPRRRGRR